MIMPLFVILSSVIRLHFQRETVLAHPHFHLGTNLYPTRTVDFGNSCKSCKNEIRLHFQRETALVRPHFHLGTNLYPTTVLRNLCISTLPVIGFLEGTFRCLRLILLIL